MAMTLTELSKKMQAIDFSMLSLAAPKGLLGKPRLFIAMEGKAELIRNKKQFAQYWVKSLDRWFEQGVDTPGIVLIKVHAERVHYWDGEESGEVKLPNEGC